LIEPGASSFHSEMGSSISSSSDKISPKKGLAKRSRRH
jgi:hypothetical protein